MILDLTNASVATLLTMTCDDNEAPPRLARTGADRCMRRNVVMNGDEP